MPQNGIQAMNAKRLRLDGRIIFGTPMRELVPPPKAAPEAPRSNGPGCRVIRLAKAKTEVFGITVNHRAIGVAPVDLERGASGANTSEI